MQRMEGARILANIALKFNRRPDLMEACKPLASTITGGFNQVYASILRWGIYVFCYWPFFPRPSLQV